MERTYLEPDGLAAPPEPYAHAIRCGDTLYIAGQVAFDEHNQIVGVGDAGLQAAQVWRNIGLAVQAAGGTLADVVKITIFLKDIRDAPSEIAVRERLFEPGRFPICTMVQVANLGLPDLLMEIDAVAALG
ncbi:MAG: translation initiation inhibitor [Actinomycetia bacterium]|jgi:2-iminobutanoate/2-iminopropanoate deaminase|nr:translation initiation inhibitor [Actinomycetes bacterium]